MDTYDICPICQSTDIEDDVCQSCGFDMSSEIDHEVNNVIF